MSRSPLSEFLRPEHFYRPVHGRIYGAIINFVERAHHQQWVMRNLCFLDRSVILCYQSGAQNVLVALWKPSLFGTFVNALVT